MDLDVQWGEVHALLGENGAGKSTLMNVVYGLVRADAGTIEFDGKEVQVHSPQDAIRLGIGMVHQHFMLIPVLTVAENIVLGHEIQNAGVMDLGRAYQTVHDLSERYGLEVDPRARVEDLSVGIQQRVEILKALYRGARLLILDEPTAVLTPQEIARPLPDRSQPDRAEGNAVIFITHKLAEVMEIADKITVMRRGKVVATTTPKESKPPDLARMMVGRPVLLRVEKQPAKPGDVLLRVEDLVVMDRRHVAVDHVSLDVRAGEILGVAGVEGNGQNELVESIVGLRAARAGHVRLGAKDVTRRSTRTRLHSGLGLIPADRHRQGIILELPISDNLILNRYDLPPYERWTVRQFRAIRATAERLIKTFDIRTQSPDQPAASLSGGNQQKLVVARELGHRSEGADRQPAHARRRRGIDRVHPPPDHQPARCRPWSSSRLGRARRGARSRRPRGGDVSGPHRRGPRLGKRSTGTVSAF